MRRILIGLTAGVLGIAGLAGTAGTADARDWHGRASYHDHGPRFRGYVYCGHDHPRWERRAWDACNHRWHYWDPCRGLWYYWCPADGCWHPDTPCP